MCFIGAGLIFHPGLEMGKPGSLLCWSFAKSGSRSLFVEKRGEDGTVKTAAVKMW
jgi:hypothetical protein